MGEQSFDVITFFGHSLRHLVGSGRGCRQCVCRGVRPFRWLGNLACTFLVLVVVLSGWRVLRTVGAPSRGAASELWSCR